MTNRVTDGELAAALKALSMDLIEKQNQTSDEICLGMQFFELWDLIEGVEIMRTKLEQHGEADKIYKKWQKDEARRRVNRF